MLDAFLQIGYRVHLASTRQFADQQWTEGAVSVLQARGLERVWIYQRFRGQDLLDRVEAHCRPRQQSLDNYHFCSWWLRRWFKELVFRIDPSCIVIHYAFADRLLDHARYRNIYRIVEMHDLLSVNLQIRQYLDAKITEFTRAGHAGDLFNPTLRWAEKFNCSDEELAIYDQYDAVIAISQQEHMILQNRLRRARAVWIPMRIPPVKLDNTYDGSPIFIASGNICNRAGLMLLINDLLHRVIAQCPDFQIDVIGDISQFAIPSSNVRYLGYVSSLGDVCQKAAFAICPVFSGTGQQIKVIEAMAHGLPVVAFRQTAVESPLQHAKNGLVATDKDDFARHLITMWRNRALCRQLGIAARATLAEADATAMSLRNLMSNTNRLHLTSPPMKTEGIA
jgi:glycosyltransferase involved in cell wall biosynthesis